MIFIISFRNGTIIMTDTAWTPTSTTIYGNTTITLGGTSTLTNPASSLFTNLPNTIFNINNGNSNDYSVTKMVNAGTMQVSSIVSDYASTIGVGFSNKPGATFNVCFIILVHFLRL